MAIKQPPFLLNGAWFSGDNFKLRPIRQEFPGQPVMVMVPDSFLTSSLRPETFFSSRYQVWGLPGNTL
jgi:hypothetical protein